MTKANIQRKLQFGRAPARTISAKTSTAATTSVSSFDQIFREIVQGLYDGRYATGQRLIESDLTRNSAPAGAPFREALKRLAAEGIVNAQSPSWRTDPTTYTDRSSRHAGASGSADWILGNIWP